MRVVKKADKHDFVDFGRTVVGGMRLKLTGPGTVELRYGGELTDATTVDHTMRTGNAYRDVWTLRPGAQTLSLWGYSVFRYAEIIGADPGDVQAASLVHPFDPNASTWSSSNAHLDRVVDFNREGAPRLSRRARDRGDRPGPPALLPQAAARRAHPRGGHDADGARHGGRGVRAGGRRPRARAQGPAERDRRRQPPEQDGRGG